MTLRTQLMIIVAVGLAACGGALVAESFAAEPDPGGVELNGPDEAAEAGADGGDEPTSQEKTFLELLEGGGPLMYPIYAASILMVAFAIERGISLRRSRIVPDEFVQNLRALVSTPPIEREKILTYCQAHPSPIARVFQAAVKRLHRPLPEIEKSIEDAGAKEVRQLRRNCSVLSGVASVSPLLGLLGTVTGMIAAFGVLSAGDVVGSEAAQKLADGIYQALVTTAAGLSVAIPSLVIYLVYNSKIEKLVGEMDDLSLEFVEAVDEHEKNGNRDENA